MMCPSQAIVLYCESPDVNDRETVSGRLTLYRQHVLLEPLSVSNQTEIFESVSLTIPHFVTNNIT